MKIEVIRFEKLFNLGNYENWRIGFEAKLDEQDTVEEAAYKLYNLVHQLHVALYYTTKLYNALGLISFKRDESEEIIEKKKEQLKYVEDELHKAVEEAGKLGEKIVKGEVTPDELSTVECKIPNLTYRKQNLEADIATEEKYISLLDQAEKLINSEIARIEACIKECNLPPREKTEKWLRALSDLCSAIRSKVNEDLEKAVKEFEKAVRQ